MEFKKDRIAGESEKEAVIISIIKIAKGLGCYED